MQPASDVIDTPGWISELATELAIDGRELTVRVDLYRDFQPISEPNGKSLLLVVAVEAVDQKPLGPEFAPAIAWVVRDDRTWRSTLERQEISNPPYRQRSRANGGPQWGPGGKVDVALEFVPSTDEHHRVLVKDVEIHRTD